MSNITKTFFTSDTHFNHRNILKFCSETRQGNDIDEMNELMIEAWNSKVALADTVYHLGDVAFGSPAKTRHFLDRLNGRLHLVKGNHDTSKYIKHMGYRFETIQDYKEIRVPDLNGITIDVILFHFPIEEWNRCSHGAYHFHGHTHGLMPESNSRMTDVGVDTRTDMSPWRLDELLLKLEDRNNVHHRIRGAD